MTEVQVADGRDAAGRERDRLRTQVKACEQLFLEMAEASDGCDGWSYRGLVLLGVIEPKEQP